MSQERAVYRRVLRRETHRSRAASAAAVAVVLALACLAIAAAVIWWMLSPAGRVMMLESLGAVRAALRGMGSGIPQGGEGLLVVGGVLACLVALALLVLAVLPGRRPRRGRVDERAGVLVDDGVLADAIADAVAAACGVRAAQVSVRVRRRAADVRITPTSGSPADREVAALAVTRVTRAAGFPLRPRVRIERAGVVA